MSFKIDKIYYTVEKDRGLDIQSWRNILKLSKGEMMTRFHLTEDELNRIYLGDVTEENKGDFEKIYFDLKRDIEVKKYKSNSRAMEKILIGGDFYKKPIFYKLLRGLLKITQEDLAQSINVSVAAVRSWEQGKSTANGPAQVLLYSAIPEDIRVRAERLLDIDSDENEDIEIQNTINNDDSETLTNKRPQKVSKIYQDKQYSLDTDVFDPKTTKIVNDTYRDMLKNEIPFSVLQSITDTMIKMKNHKEA